MKHSMQSLQIFLLKNALNLTICFYLQKKAKNCFYIKGAYWYLPNLYQTLSEKKIFERALIFTGVKSFSSELIGNSCKLKVTLYSSAVA